MTLRITDKLTCTACPCYKTQCANYGHLFPTKTFPSLFDIAILRFETRKICFQKVARHVTPKQVQFHAD